MTGAEAAGLLAVVASYWGNFRPDDPERTVTAWFDALADVPYGEAEAAVRSLGRDERRFAPSPGEVRAEAARRFGAGCPFCGRRGSHVHDRLPGMRLLAFGGPVPAALTADEAERLGVALVDAARTGARGGGADG